ncbi:dual specificity mitogen-activated protein kinase kinase 1 [Colletotrichum chrysophilum]|uniref:Dual specificity mitogen-activated protein kinase kinase 1 n=1 Tax=Colletotrichum chrysophilum TaxID=1836956 RepID=A0AAD9AC48_9PEZI|nr:dual specificity mitogen-activated protein kinase kinase 1 [Colletotrichum chrysophilum]
MDSFVAEGRTDRYLPYHEANLPNCIPGGLRSRFMKLQSLVRYHLADVRELEESGKHVHLPRNADAYFFSMEDLGSGRFAKVDKVRSYRTADIYARKQIRRGESVLEDHTQLKAFENELKSLKEVSHRHAVKLVGSYTDPHHLALIMSPIADVDLKRHLLRCEKSLDNRKFILRHFFGCLTTALAYIHSKNIRHKDIKPENILVKGDTVYLADFGTSKVCLDGHLTTNGEPKEGTPRYWAPEAGYHANRNRSSDIWSLGCVFLEMATTLLGRTQLEMLEFFNAHGNGNHHCIGLNLEATREWIDELRRSSFNDSNVLDWTDWMLQPKPDDRPTAAQLRGKIKDLDAEFEYICYECASRNGMKDCKTPPPTSPDVGRAIDGPGAALLQDVSEQLSLDKTATKDADSGQRLPQQTGSKILAEGKDGRDVKAQEPKVQHTAGPDTADVKPWPKPKVRFAKTDQAYESRDSRYSAGESIRFAGLPEDRRPEPTKHQEEEEESFNQVPNDAGFIIPDPINAPPFSRRECLPLPRASLVPSYILAGTNHFSRNELEHYISESSSSNVFLYGRLMFPSVLHAIAARSTKGAYSPDLQRRIMPSSDDWNSANLSIQRASEIMMPAKLRGYDRWRPTDLQCAVIQRSEYNQAIIKKPRLRGAAPLNPPEEVIGFIMVGVKKEAIRYLDLLFAQDERDLDEVKPRSNDEAAVEDGPTRSPLRRESVNVDVELDTGEIAQVHAHTYVWKHHTADLGQLWEEDHFLRGSRFQSLVEHENRWKAEEQALATSMQISFALVGDYVCSAVLTGNVVELKTLLDREWSPDAPCRYYGNPLQAAVVIGNEDMVQLLLDYGANVNQRDGRYGSALIAAAFASRKSITRLLLRRGADVFADHPTHGNSLYQAVGQSDYAIVEMLLEHASWLIEDWGEIRDLANEIGDSEIKSLIRQYDVRQMYKLSLPMPQRSQNPKELEGRKGVLVTVVALNAGASMSILPIMRSAIGPVKALIDELRRADEIQEQNRRAALENAGSDQQYDNEVKPIRGGDVHESRKFNRGRRHE